MADLLKDFIDNRYIIKGFEITSKRKLRYGLRVFLRKESKGTFFSNFENIYIYYYDGKATVESMNECFKDYVWFYEDEEFRKGDKGFFLCSAINEKAFNSLKRAKIENNEIRNSIKPIVLERQLEDKEVKIEPREVRRKKQTFIVHGRDAGPAFELQRLLERELKLNSILLQDQPHSGKTLIEKLEEYSNVDYAFVILTPDDVGALKGERPKEKARQNVVLEWGLFVARIGRENVCVLLKGDIELPSDMHGIGFYRFYESVEEVFLKIRKELQKAKIID